MVTHPVRCVSCPRLVVGVCTPCVARLPSAVCRLPLRTAPQTKRRPPCSVFFVLVLGLCSFFLVLLFTTMRTGADSDARRTAAARAPSGTAPATKSSASVTGAESRGTRPAREGRLLWRKPSQCVSFPRNRLPHRPPLDRRPSTATATKPPAVQVAPAPAPPQRGEGQRAARVHPDLQ